MNIELSSSPKPTREDGTAYGEVETRDHSDANELTGLTPDGATTALSMSYDAAGNLLSREIEGSSGTTTMHLTVYRGLGDAWNRLVAVDYGSDERLKQSYNGLNWRVLKWSDATHGAEGELTQRRAMYYSPNWQLLEELIDDNWGSESGDEDHTRRMMYIWGARYIDDIVARRQTDPLGTHEPGVTTSTWYHVTDTLFSTVAILSRSGTLVERISYDAYGNARHHRRADLTGDGAVNVFDNNTLLDDWQDYVVGDLNRDGIVNEADQMQLLNDWGAAIPSGRLTPQGSSGTDNIVGYAGYLFNAEIHGSGLYTVRHRHYAPDLGRWLSRDPIGYVDGMSLHEYVRASPKNSTDPFGQFGIRFAPNACGTLIEQCMATSIVQIANEIASSACSPIGVEMDVSCHYNCRPGLQRHTDVDCDKGRFSIVICPNDPGFSCNTLTTEIMHVAHACMNGLDWENCKSWRKDYWDDPHHSVCGEYAALRFSGACDSIADCCHLACIPDDDRLSCEECCRRAIRSGCCDSIQGTNTYKLFGQDPCGCDSPFRSF